MVDKIESYKIAVIQHDEVGIEIRRQEIEFPADTRPEEISTEIENAFKPWPYFIGMTISVVKLDEDEDSDDSVDDYGDPSPSCGQL